MEVNRWTRTCKHTAHTRMRSGTNTGALCNRGVCSLLNEPGNAANAIQ